MIRSGAEPEAQWPPRSPHEVLLSTPKGREKLRRMAEQASPSPSPTRRGRLAPNRSGNSHNNTEDLMDLDEDEDEEDEEDEEMLQLKLQAIQAKLKLKKLQSAKAKKALGGDTAASRSASTPIPDVPIASRARPRAQSLRSGAPTRPQSQIDVQVPASPVRRAQTAQGDNSPSRVRLGIDKGIKASDVSLKRAPSVPSFKRTAENNQSSSQGGYLRRAHTPALGGSEQPAKQERPMTFSERMAAARSEDKIRQERRERIKQARSNAFDIGKQEMEQFKSNAKDIPDVPLQPEQYSRDDVVAGGRIRRGNTMPSLRRPTLDESRPGTSSGVTSGSQSETSTQHNKKITPSKVPEEEASAFEPYSSVHLSKRVIPHSVLTRNLSGKKIYVIKDLLKHVKAPEYQLPEIEQDIVVFGILASKSDPRSHKISNNNLMEKTQSDPNRGKYMVLQLVDLQWELELFLFGTGFDRYWQLVPGTLLAILNPSVMPPPPGRTDTGRFSLVINSGHDTILEVGTARDIGYCKSIKKDGECCNSWVNRKRTEFCEFHMNLKLAKHRQARQDVNAFNTGLGPQKDGAGGRRYQSSYRTHGWDQQANDPKKRTGGNFDRSTQSQFFISKPSAASMIDNEVLGGQVADRVERGEALRRRLATEEKERELMKTLGKIGSGAGKEYMQRGGNAGSIRASGRNTPGVGMSSGLGSSFLSTTSSQDPNDQPRQDVDARSLGLIKDRGKEPKMHLSPVKRKRSETGQSSSSSSTTTTTFTATHNTTSKPALGWGGGLKDKLARMKDGEKLQPTSTTNSNPNPNPAASSFEDASSVNVSVSMSSASTTSRSPARKKTRFVTAKGIREAGRESLGAELTSGPGPGPGSASTSTSTSASTFKDYRSSTPGGSSRGRTDIRAGRGRMVVLNEFDDDDDDDDDELEILR